jgi:hypothetical protein
MGKTTKIDEFSHYAPQQSETDFVNTLLLQVFLDEKNPAEAGLGYRSFSRSFWCRRIVLRRALRRLDHGRPERKFRPLLCHR